MKKTINQRCDEVKSDCLKRIREIRGMLDTVERVVQSDSGSINPVGELQSQPSMLECRLATLGMLRLIRDEETS